MKQLYDTTKKLAGKYSKPERPVEDKEGRPITEIQERRNRWVEYFEELLNRPATMNPPDIEAAHTHLLIDVNPLTTEEIRMAVRQIKNGKVAGPNNIPAGALKSDIEVTTSMLYLLLKKIWEEEQEPMDWKGGHLIKIPKKGDLSKLVDWIMKTSTSEVKHGIQWTAQNQLYDLDFADDLAFLSRTHEQMQTKTASVAAVSASVGLSIHKGKTKVPKFNTENSNPITLDGETLEDVESFT
ncbi:unnamed protein product [Schistosoma curassoni]|uniref:Reverse transcriptase domain-containing protein n=1 Tax=Schistosoma curassoni TaxID=6186 RepID=A0A183KJT1_9TREM|nr:unnamed protein product [Schistosoma curassoni]